VSGLNQAVRNANDGISMLQTAEGSMQQVTSLLQSMRTLAVQASNDTNSTSDRASIQAQMDQLYAEIDRVASSTSFNGVNLLDGTGGSKTFQVGANADQTINVSLASVKTQDLSLNGYSPLGSLNSGRVSTSASTVGLTIDGTDITMAGATSAAAEAAAINTYTATTGVTATAYNTYRGQGNVTGVVSGLTINGYSVGSSASMNELVGNINRDVSGLTGITAVLNSDGSITLSNTTGNDITVGGVTNNSGLTASTYHGYLALSGTNGGYYKRSGCRRYRYQRRVCRAFSQR
jgi:flagellin